jgi:multiple sugar transport system substrate-binding protein
MRAKLSVAILLLVALSLILSSCAAPAPATPEVVEKIITKEVPKEVVKERPKLTMWVDHFFFVQGAEALLKSYVLEYAQQEGFDVEFVQDSYDVMRPRIDAAMESKTLPDVLYTSSDVVAKMRRVGQASELTDVVSELNANMGGFTEGMLAAVTADGKQYGVPLMSSTEMMYVRQDLLDAAGLPYPETWEDLLEAARKMNNPPTVWGWGPQVSNKAYDAERHLMAMIWAFGGSLFAEDGETVVVDSEATRQVIEMIKQAWDEDIIPKEVLTWDDSGNNKGYQSGKVAIIENTGSIVNWMKDNDPDLLKVTALGMPPAGPAGRFIQGDCWAFAVPTYSKNAELAKGLIKYIHEPGRYQALIEAMGGLRIPVYGGLSSMAMWEDPALKPLIDAVPYTYMAGYPGPVSDAALEAFRQLVVSGMVTHVLADGWTVDQAIDDAETILQRIVEESK